MPDQFEMAFADIAYSYLQEKVPNLLEFLVGFEVVDQDDTGSKGLGIFPIKIGDRYLYVPVFYMNGELKPLELLWLKDKDIFVPLDEDWIAYLLKNKPLVLGEETEEAMPRFDVPDLDLFARPPITGKHVSAEHRDIFNQMAARSLSILAEIQEPSTKALDFLSKSSGPIKNAFLQMATADPWMIQALGRFYDVKMVKEAATYRPVAPQPQVDPFHVKVASLEDPETLRSLPPALREKVYLGEMVFVADDDAILTKFAQLYDVQLEKDLQNPHTSGVYTLVDHTGDLRQALVLLAPQGADMYGDRKATVIDLKSKRFVRAPVGRIWVKKLPGLVESPDLDEEGEIPDGLFSDRKGGKVGSLYTLMSPALHSSVPFEILQVFKDSAGLTHYRVKFVEGDQAYPTEAPVGVSTKLDERQSVGSMDAQQPLVPDTGYGVQLTLAPETAGGADKIYVMGDELVVPSSYKLIKLTKPSSDGPKFALGNEAAIHDQILNVTKTSGYEDRLDRIGLKFDGMLFHVRSSRGTQYTNLTKHAAAEVLADRFFMRPDHVLGYLKKSEESRGRFHDLWAVHKATNEDLAKKAQMSRPGGVARGGGVARPGGVSRGGGIQRGGVFQGRGASAAAAEARTKQMMLQTAQQSKQAQIVPLPEGIPDPIFTSDVSVAPGGKQLFNEELIPVPSMYDPPRPLGQMENMYTGPSGLPGEPPSTPSMDTELAMQAAQLGQQTVFDHSMLGSLAQISDVSELINQYLPDLEAALDKLGRLLFLYWWHQDQFKENFGITQMRDLEDQLRNVFKSFGELVLDLKQKERPRTAPLV